MLLRSMEFDRESTVNPSVNLNETNIYKHSSLKENTCFLDLPPVLISEIFMHLDARDLTIVSCVCTVFWKLSSDCNGWKDFYCDRWEIPPSSKPSGAPQKSWRELYLDREARSKAFMGRYQIDRLHGHMERVRAVRLVAALNIIFTAGYDRVIRMWNMEEALPITCSPPLNCTIRAIQADMDVLVVGGTEPPLRCWRARREIPHAFDISNQGSEICLWGHSGPVTCLGLDCAKIYSGSWDMSIRVWDRCSMKCLNVLKHMDWVWALVPRGKGVFATSGSDLYSWDVVSGEELRVRFKIHVGQAYCVECSQSGDFLFTGGEDGAIHMFDERSPSGGQLEHEESKPLASWVPHSGPVYSLAFEDPWLVSASGDGKLSIIDVRKLLNSFSSSKLQVRINDRLQLQQPLEDRLQNIEPPQRMLHGFFKNLYSVDIGAERIVCGGDEKIVRIWDFSQAVEIERRMQALRTIHFEKKEHGAVNPKGKQVNPCTVMAERNGVNAGESWIWQRGNERNKVSLFIR
eukprot:Gb_13592 [translate_table: standard]